MRIPESVLAHEVRMGTVAVDVFTELTMVEREPVAPWLSGRIGPAPWAASMQIRVVESYPPNLWVMVDRDGNAVACGILNPPTINGAR